MAASISTSYNELYQEEGNALLQYLQKLTDLPDREGHELSLRLPLELHYLVAPCFARIIVNSGAVSTTIVVLSQEEAIVWSQQLSQWIKCSPHHYFTNIVLIMPQFFALIIDELNNLKANGQYLRIEREEAGRRIELLQLATTQCGQFASEIVNHLVNDLLIRDQVEVERIMRDFTMIGEWLPLPGTMAVNLRTRVVCERTKSMRTMRRAAFPFTWNADQSDEINFSWAPKLIQLIASLKPDIKEDDVLIALFRCLLGDNVEPTLLSVFGPGNEDTILLFSLILKSIIGETIDTGKIGEEYCQPEFLQGMFNYIIVQGGSRY